MPAPTTKPRPSPKAPPVCQKGPKKPEGAPQLASARILSALVVAIVRQSGLSTGYNFTMPLPPDAVPNDWLGYTATPGFEVFIWLGKHEGQHLYDVSIDFELAGSPFFGHTWLNVRPTLEDPLSLPSLTYKDPSTDQEATVTITS